MSGTGEITTPTLGLIKPPIGADTDVWGDRLNTNSDTLDANAASLAARVTALENEIASLNLSRYQEAVGTVKFWFSVTTFPPGYLLCDAELWPVSEFPDLYALLGTTFGGTAGVNFRTPDMRGCVPVGFDLGTGRLQGQYGADVLGPPVGGAAAIQLAYAHMPNHQHSGNTGDAGTHAHGYVRTVFTAPGPAVSGNPVIQAQYQGAVTDPAGDHYHFFYTSYEGGNQPHGNCQPGVLGHWIIKALLL